MQAPEGRQRSTGPVRHRPVGAPIMGACVRGFRWRSTPGYSLAPLRGGCLETRGVPRKVPTFRRACNLLARGTLRCGLESACWDWQSQRENRLGRPTPHYMVRTMRPIPSGKLRVQQSCTPYFPLHGPRSFCPNIGGDLAGRRRYGGGWPGGICAGRLHGPAADWRQAAGSPLKKRHGRLGRGSHGRGRPCGSAKDRRQHGQDGRATHGQDARATTQTIHGQDARATTQIERETR